MKRKVCPLAILPSVLRTHYKEVFDILFSYSLIKQNDVTSAYNIWILVGMNDVNYDVDRSKDIYLCFQTDKYMNKRYRALGVLGEKVYVLKRFSLEDVYFYLVVCSNNSTSNNLISQSP